MKLGWNFFGFLFCCCWAIVYGFTLYMKSVYRVSSSLGLFFVIYVYSCFDGEVL